MLGRRSEPKLGGEVAENALKLALASGGAREGERTAALGEERPDPFGGLEHGLHEHHLGRGYVPAPNHEPSRGLGDGQGVG